MRLLDLPNAFFQLAGLVGKGMLQPSDFFCLVGAGNRGINRARAHRTLHNQRRDFLHKAARSLANQYGVIVMEDLKILNMSAAPEP